MNSITQQFFHLGETSMKIVLMTVTPELAAHYLQNNKSNRKLHPSHVARLADDIRSGRWQLTHQGIAINRHGELLDGQHRLRAIVATGVAVPMMVATGVISESAMGLMVDVGAVRTATDISGQSREIVQPCVVLQLNHDGVSTRSKSRTLEFVDAFGGDVRTIRGNHRGIRGVTTAPFIAAALIQSFTFGKPRIAAAIKRMSELDYDAMTISEKSYVRAVHQNRIISSNSLDVFCKGLSVFDPNNSAVTKIYASPVRLDAARELLRTQFAARRVQS